MSPEEDRTRDTVDSEPKHYQLSYSGPPTLFQNWYIAITMSLSRGVKCQSFLFVSWPLFECQARLLIFLVGRSSECSITLPARPPSSKSSWRFMSQQHVQSVSGTETAQTVIPSRAATLRNKLQIQLAVFPSQSTLTPRQSVPSLAPLRDVFGRAAAITVPCVQSPVWLGWGCFLFFCCFFFVVFCFLRSPAISLGFTTFGWDFCVCARFF